MEPRNADVLSRSLLCGHRVTDNQRASEQGAEGVFVSQIGPEVFRVCDALVVGTNFDAPTARKKDEHVGIFIQEKHVSGMTKHFKIPKDLLGGVRG